MDCLPYMAKNHQARMHMADPTQLRKAHALSRHRQPQRLATQPLRSWARPEPGESSDALQGEGAAAIK